MLRVALLALGCVLAGACVQPEIRHCPEVDCPKDMVCDGRGGCAMPEQLAQCAGKSDGAECSYADTSGATITGACTSGLCLPIGCGNNIVTPNEVCDDGNTINGDGCSADCTSDETCGNTSIDPAKGEQCDDGNHDSGDGCQADCKNPRCGDGVKDVSLNEDCDAGPANSMQPDAACRPTCQQPRCGDGVLDLQRGEVCDDGNVLPNDGCAGDCKSDETCGNGVVDVLAGEVCDDDNTTSGDGCSGDCQSVETCGNGIMDTSLGEVCDDSNTVSGDGCSSDCRSLETCGNNIVDTITEQCDKGGANSNAPNAECRTDCKLPRCGDGSIDNIRLGEACDAGTNNANTANAECRTNCQPRRCGDMVVDFMHNEVCDDGNVVSGDNCSADCRSLEVCGNAIVDTIDGEQCDAGGSNANAPNATCRTDCKLPRCGDAIVDNITLSEGCDLGALNSNAPNATCRANCQPRRCGDSVVDTSAGEVCDDGNTASNDGCSPDCKSNETCGNGIVDVAKGEQCDAGGANSNAANAACRTDCKLPRCGDGATDTNLGEACDAGALNANTANATCRTNCQPRRCGDSVIDNLSGEVCDDGNTVSNDGCAPDCKSDETCGNGIIDVSKGEQCDAGGANANTANAPCRTNCQLPRCGDGAVDTTRGEACDAGAANSNLANAICRTNCQPQRCGDSILDNTKGEVCDDGNIISGDNCSADCKSNETCRNGIVDTAKGEQCDDNNAVDADFCHNNCTLPRCGDGIVDFNEQCDNGAANSNSPNASCRTSCTSRRCGDQIVDNNNGEVCDDGNLNAGDGCRPDCASNETCGNAVVDIVMGEVCDDGNGRGRDGCSACKNEDAVVLMPGQTPSARYEHAMAYDASRQRVVMFGGYFNGTLGDTWEWDGVAWTQMRPRQSPSPRYAASMAYDPVRKRVVLFGGYNNGYRGDTWEWDGNNWVDRQPATAPSPRHYHGLNFDAKRKRIIMYGGYANDDTTGATWEWNGTNWTQLTTTGHPGFRGGHRMVYDVARGYTLLWGGSATSTWTFNGTTNTWTQAQATPPTGVTSGWQVAMTYDPTRGAVIANRDGNETFEWNGTTWVIVAGTSPLDREYATMVYDAARKQIVHFGGYQNVTPTGYKNDTWLRTGTTWTLAPGWTEPPPRSRAAMAYDPVRGKTVLFGGNTSTSSWNATSLLNDTWEFDGRKWTSVTAGTPPPPRAGQRMDYNRSTRTMVMQGGDSYDSVNDARINHGELYTFNGSAWSAAPMSTGGPALRNNHFGYDAANNRVVVYGGFVDGNDWSSHTASQWTWTATGGWSQTPSTPPGLRQNGALGYDPLRQRMVLFSGHDQDWNLLGDVWELQGSTWTQITASGPSGRRGHSLMFNPDRGQLVAIGASAQGLEDMWEWSGSTWTQRPIDNAPSERYRAGLAFHNARHEIVMFGGRDQQDFDIVGRTQLIRYRANATVESCNYATHDYDGDGAAGCADSDCWSVCTPLCYPGMSAASCTSFPRCGDGTCNGVENCQICPGDCTTGCTTPLCGDYECNGTENATSCPNDC